MKVRSIAFDSEEEFESATVQLSADEVTYMALVLGQMNWQSAEAIAGNGGNVSHEIYSGLTGGILNKVYEDGVNDGLRASERLIWPTSK